MIKQQTASLQPGTHNRPAGGSQSVCVGGGEGGFPPSEYLTQETVKFCFLRWGWFDPK